jgi:hypothetical protein
MIKEERKRRRKERKNMKRKADVQCSNSVGGRNEICFSRAKYSHRKYILLI